MARRIPAGQIQKAYKRLYDVYQRYTNKWLAEKGYVNAEYFNAKLTKVLQSLQIELEGGNLSDIPQQKFQIDSGAGRQMSRMYDLEQGRTPFEPQEEEYDLPTGRFTQGRPISLRQTGSRPLMSIRRKSTLRPLIPTAFSKKKRRTR